MLEFGKVIKYFDNGFGFIKPMDSNSELYGKEVFFHIKAVKKFESDLVGVTDGVVKELYFWFTCKDGKKGKEVSEFWSKSENIPHEYTTSILEKYSADLIKSGKIIPKAIFNVTQPTAPLKNSSQKTFNKIPSIIKPIDHSAKSLANRYSLTSINSEELSSLLNEMSEKKFHLSSQLSKYITTNKLGNKYPNIAGIVTMSNSAEQWDFDGGFPTGIYRIICQELNLTAKGTSARVVKFTSYQDQENDFDDLF